MRICVICEGSYPFVAGGVSSWLQGLMKAMPGHVFTIWAIGAQDYVLDGAPVTLNAWHQDQVVRRPEGAEVIACNDFCENAALVYGDRAFTVQAHPEFDDTFIRGMLEKRAPGLVPDPLIAAAAGRVAEEKSSPLLAAKIADFFLKPRG